ncbi:Uncharacterised protein [Suttonella indologenes]|uniref:Uncharacterized protein n=1 Tax=Suttonella indologenes TaxID=13276 RepID=A0A380N191_9GAMM|nr:Uncharacterised protein [Suttonella indologenes]
MWLYLLAMIVGLSVLVYSADVFIDGASHLAKKFHVPKVIIVKEIKKSYKSTRSKRIVYRCNLIANPCVYV